MSIELFQRVMARSRSRGPARAVLLVIAFRFNPRAGAWGSVGGLARDTGLSTRTVQRALDELERIGELEQTPFAKRVKTPGGPQAVSRFKVTL